MASPPTPSIYVPYLPPISPYVLPAATFDAIISAYGIRLYWLKSHACPCIYNYDQPGSPDPACQTCQGRGIYWDTPLGPFMGLITWTDFSPRPDEPGAQVNEVRGLVQQGQPTLSIPSAATGVYSGAAVYDTFVELDAVTRYDAQLQAGVRTALPYQQNVTVAASGAVSVYDNINKVLVPVSGYTVSGVSVFLPSGYAQGTNYIVEFTASPAYVALRPAGAMPHTRPFGQVNEPRRFKLQALDLWTRARYAGEIPLIP